MPSTVNYNINSSAPFDDAPKFVGIFLFNNVTTGGTAGADFEFTARESSGRFKHLHSERNGAGDVTFTLEGSPHITRAIAVNFAGVALPCTIVGSTVQVVGDPAQRVLLAVW
jgi:hypothetical protein